MYKTYYSLAKTPFSKALTIIILSSKGRALFDIKILP